MGKWQLPTRNIDIGGRFQIVMTKSGHPGVDVTFFRGVPTEVTSYSSADPFGDAACVLTFPQMTAFEDKTGAEFRRWFDLYSNVDIWWVPAEPIPTGSTIPPDLQTWINPVTQNPDIIAEPRYSTIGFGVVVHDQRTKVFEGWVTSIEYDAQDDSHSVQLQCSGALFQLDRYLQKPFYPPRPQPLEAIIREAVNPINKPHLRTKHLEIQWPSGWATVIPPAPKKRTEQDFLLQVDGKPGSKWSGYASRDTGAWDRILTEYIQNQLSIMLTKPDSGVAPGQQWTMALGHQTTTPNRAGRRPILKVRDNNPAADFTLWIGTPGVTGNFTRDSTQMANIIYGDGTSLDGVTWNGMVINNSRTSWMPLAWMHYVWPIEHNKTFNRDPFVSEAYQKFDTGISQAQAEHAADVILRRDADPGYTGDLTLAIDPPGMNRWLIRAGMTVKILGLAGTRDDGIKFHITQVQASPPDGTVQLTLDSKYRDLLTVEEARARTRDPLTPTVMLNPSKFSVQIQDLTWPWSTSRGSGFIKRAAKDWWNNKPSDCLIPYQSHFLAHPPKSHHYRDMYLSVDANNKLCRRRWNCVPVLTSAKGTIRRIEVFALNWHGHIIPCPFHVSFYYLKVHASDMPYLLHPKHSWNTGGNAFIPNGFTTVDPDTGLPWEGDNLNAFAPDPNLVDGALWGNVMEIGGVVRKDRAGFWPGSEAAGSPPSGILVDNTPWSYDNTAQHQTDWDPTLKQGWFHAGQKGHAPLEAIELWAMFYAEWHERVYFTGRIWQQLPGESTS